MSVKECNKCQSIKPVDGFYVAKNTADGLYGSCKVCILAKNRAYRVRQGDTLRVKKKAEYYRRAYNLTPKSRDALIQASKGVCAICALAYREANVDHCHVTGKVRGVLCSNCNRGIGHLKDDIATLYSAIRYLENSQ